MGRRRRRGRRRDLEDITNLMIAGARFDLDVWEIAELKGGYIVFKFIVYKVRKEVMTELSQRAVPPTNALFF